MTRFTGNSRSDAFLDAISRAATFAFQPIVNIHTGHCYGFEALLRNVDKLGFNSIADFFDYAWNAGILHRVDMALRRIAISQFARSEACQGAKLFYNIDGRTFESQDYHPHQTGKILAHFKMPPENLVLELSEKYDNASARHLGDTLAFCREQKYQLAIDDFGRGFSEMQMLYEHQPDFIKIDRFFISGLADDSKKRVFVSSIVNLAHVLGITVLAEGVETEREFLTCKEIGCDLVQGFFVAPPTVDHETLRTDYQIVAETNRRDRRRRSSDEFLIRDFIETPATLLIGAGMDAVFEAFRVNKEQTLFPVLSADGTPLGLVREQDMKDFIYMQYGRDLLQNKAYGRSLKDFLRPCPSADINSEAERILEIYAIGDRTDGIAITSNFQYVGFLTADALLRLLNEKNLNVARDQNPLTKLPGNNSLGAYVSAALADGQGNRAFVYLDFNDFKPFNDTYGFRQGDRAITLFANLMREVSTGTEAYLAHIGGDDFFIGFSNTPENRILETVDTLLTRFRDDAASLYSPEHREAGGIEAKDRHGKRRRFELLSCAAAVVFVPEGAGLLDTDTLLDKISKAKHEAKKSPDRVSIHRFGAKNDDKVVRLG